MCCGLLRPSLQDPKSTPFNERAGDNTSSWPRRVFYVRNHKAATKFLLENLRFILQAADRSRRSDLRQDVRQLNPGNPGDFVFTIVREPAAAVLSAYVTISSLASRFREAKLDSAEKASVLFTPCDVKNATERFLRFLDQLENGTNLGASVFHAYPQVMKIGHVQPRDSGEGDDATQFFFDAIGRTETLLDDVQAIRAMVGLQADWRSELSTRLEQVDSSMTKRGPCSRIDVSHPDVVRKICRLYAADYICLGYQAPEPCIAAGIL